MVILFPRGELPQLDAVRAPRYLPKFLRVPLTIAPHLPPHTADLVMLMLTSESQQVCNFPARNCLKMLHLRDFIPHTPQHFTFYHNKKLFKCLLNSTLKEKFQITFYCSSFERIIIFE